jgi:hypothetical protein
MEERGIGAVEIHVGNSLVRVETARGDPSSYFVVSEDTTPWRAPTHRYPPIPR